MTARRVWVVLQLKEGQVPRVSWDAVAAAQRLAGLLGTRAEAVLLGGGGPTGVAAAAREVAGRDLAAVHVAEHEALRGYTPGAYIGALAPALREARPDFVLFPHTYQTVDYVPRLAQAVGAGLLPEVTGFDAPAEGAGELLWTRPVLGGKLQARVRIKGDGPVLVSVQAGAFPAESGAAAAAPPGSDGGRGPAEIKPLAADLSAIRPDREILGYEEVGGSQVDLSKAEVIVAVGRGLGGPEKLGPIEELARALGGEIGASRPVIDSGWLPRERQIGSSGQTVAPKLYIAAGISGAIQHLVGMKGSTVIVAINKDPSAPIFTVADYGLVGDLHELVPALTAAIKAAK
ncbi:MAG TPA: electron transfer flavoprotein subunit alpha/FixB family protein [Thermoanaerobaculia bacterium]|nr:electron transfer flavoprotein subunit alpha/FixB family protein [Thermoanaerobaculia bacterium]